jgi:predicted enzyme related to lactoylglutathione lyase
VEVKHVLTILAVADVSRAARFYAQALGWRPAVEAPVYVELQGPSGMRLGLYERQGFGRNTGQMPMAVPAGALAPAELYFHVDDVPAAAERLTAAGARVLSAAALRDWGDEAAYFADPDGNVVVVAKPARPPA